MQGFILTYCPSPDVLYGNLLTAKTLRVGFPTAKIHVVDNASILEARPIIEKAYRNIGCSYYQLNNRVAHAAFLFDILKNFANDSVMFLDPDLIFWGSLEEVIFDKLIHGWRIPNFYDPYTECNTVSRIHTSLLIFPKLAELREKFVDIKRKKLDFEFVFPTMRQLNGVWYHWDTMASMCEIFKEQVGEFSDAELNLYDHLFCGTHFNTIKDRVQNLDFEEAHAAARDAVFGGDLQKLRSLRTQQEKFFKSSVWK